MTLQKKFIDIVVGSFVQGASSNGVAFAAVAHGLGAVPDFVIPNITSVGITGTNASPYLMGVGGTATLATIGLASSSNGIAHAPIAFNAMVWKFWEPIR